MKKTLLITATVFAVLISALIFAAIILNSPSLVATRAVTGAVDDFSARKEFKPIVNTISSAVKNGSVDVSFKNLTKNGGDYWDKETSFMGKLYFSKNAMLFDDVNLTLNGEKITAEAYISDEYIYVKEDKILNGTCGIYLPEFEYELKNSIFAPDSGSKYALDKDTYDRIITLNKNREDSKDIEKDIEKLSERVGRDVWKIFLENAEISSQKEKIRLNGEKTKVRTITIEIDSEALENIIYDVYDYLRYSDDIIDFIEEHEDFLISILGENYDDRRYDSLVEAYEKWLKEGLDEVDEWCDDIYREFGVITVNIATRRNSAKLLELSIESDRKTIISFKCGKAGFKRSDEIEIELFESSVTYSVKANNKKGYEGKIEYIDPENHKYDINISIDKELGKYTVISEHSYYYNDESTQHDKYTIKGTVDRTGDTLMFSVDNIVNKFSITDKNNSQKYESNSGVYKMEFAVVIDERDKMPAYAETYAPISKIKEKNLDAWINEFELMLERIERNA